jgi:8-oxo-dGTP pyrophosphatase MutT (NUDIX family)
VLIPIYFKKGEAHLLFTKRTDKVEHHKGQISFPGGRKDEEDRNLKYTALRETQEEVGIYKTDVTVVGETDRFLTNTMYLVTPFVGFFDYPYQFQISRDEIDRLIEVPLFSLTHDQNFEIRPLVRNNFTWQIHYYTYKTDVIWGVTGFLLSNFLSIVFELPRNVHDQGEIQI